MEPVRLMRDELKLGSSSRLVEGGARWIGDRCLESGGKRKGGGGREGRDDGGG